MVQPWSISDLRGLRLGRLTVAGPLNTRVRETGGGDFQHTDPEHAPRHDLRKRKHLPDTDMDNSDPDLSMGDGDLAKSDPDLTRSDVDLNS